jgi:hypothetical protein
VSHRSSYRNLESMHVRLAGFIARECKWPSAARVVSIAVLAPFRTSCRPEVTDEHNNRM